MFKQFIYLLIITIVNARGGGHGGHSGHSSHSHSHGHTGHRNSVRVVGTAVIVDLIVFHRFNYILEDNYRYNISYYREFNDSIKLYSCIYYKKEKFINQDIVVNLDLKKYPYNETENLSKYCTYKYLDSYHGNDLSIIYAIILLVILYYSCCCFYSSRMY